MSKASNRVDNKLYDKQVTTAYLPKNVFRDDVKWILVPTKVLLDYVALWPEKFSNLLITLRTFLFLSTITIFFGQIVYIVSNARNFTKCISGVTVFVITIEVLIRQTFIIYNRTRVSRLLSVVYFEFWPSDFVRKDFQTSLRNETLYLVGFCFIYTSSAVLSSIQYFMIPIILNNGELPLSTNFYAHIWQESPYFEILLVWEGVMFVYIAITVCSFDMLYISLLWNCIAQFKILKYFIQSDFKDLVQKNKPRRNLLLHKILKHHQKVIRTCKEFEETFTFFTLSLILSNTATVCLPGFLGTIVQPVELFKVFGCFTGHFCELLVYCFLGSELIHESASLSDTIFSCDWQLLKGSADFKKKILLMMVRSQGEVRLTAAGFGVLDLPTFLKVLKLSFSFYTLLNSVINKA